MSVSGCLNSASITAAGQVQMSAPMRAASTMCIGCRASSDEHLGLEVVVVVDLDDLADQVHARGRDVVEPADERADEGRADLGGEQRLRRREDQRDVDARPLDDSVLHACTPVLRERHLDDDVLVDRARSRPSRIMPSKSVATTSALVGPLHDLADLLEDLAVVAGSFASSDGLVVTPSMMPSGTSASISLRLPESMKSFIGHLQRVDAGLGRSGPRSANRLSSGNPC